MAEYIKRDTAIRAVMFPSGAAAVRCTNCGCALIESEYRLNNWNYCPVCGAKMDGGANDES